MNHTTKQANRITRSYLDWAATAIPDPLDAALLDKAGISAFANPSSMHEEGRRAREALENARARCAAVLGVAPDTLYFTSGGTESNALVLHSLLRRQGKAPLLYSAAEHPSVRENCLALETLGFPVSAIPLEKDGRVSAETLARSIEKRPDVRFAAIMGVNNETGSVNNIASLANLLRAHQRKTSKPIHLHCDMVQALGKIPLDLGGWGVDSASFSAHKLGGLRGIGLLYLKKPLSVLAVGGGQEHGIRSGTENTLGALSFADVIEHRAAPSIVQDEHRKAFQRLAYLTAKLKAIPRCKLIPIDRDLDDDSLTSRFSPWIVQVRFQGVPGEVMQRALNDEGIAISTGAACSSASKERPALAAMGLSKADQLEGVRISQGWSTTQADFDALLSAIEKTLSFL